MFPGIEGLVGNIIKFIITSENILQNIRAYSCILNLFHSR